MTRAHIIHGFNVSDGGKKSVLRFEPFLRLKGFEVVPHDYGWTGVFMLRRNNAQAIEMILPFIEPGDVIVAHSNGCLIAWELVQAGAPVSSVVCVQPAMRRDTFWPEHVQVLCFYNRSDWVVALGRMWGRFATRSQPWRNRHGWGAAGRHGFTAGQPNVTNKNTCSGLTEYDACGHSTAFRKPMPRVYWGTFASHWLSTQAKG